MLFRYIILIQYYFILLIDVHTEQNALKYQVLDGIVWFDFFSICITSQSGAWILCLIERKFNVHYAIV